MALAAGQPGVPFPAPARLDDVWTVRCPRRNDGAPQGHLRHVPAGGGHGRTRGRVPAKHRGRDGGRLRPRQLVCTPLAQAAGLLADATLRLGGTVVLQGAFDAAEVLAPVERERITDLFLPPPLLCQLLDHPDSFTADPGSLRRVAYGGCRSAPGRLAEAARRLGPY